MGNATAQAEYIFDEAEAEAALKGVFDAKALRQLENNLRVIRNNIFLSWLESPTPSDNRGTIIMKNAVVVLLLALVAGIL